MRFESLVEGACEGEVGPLESGLGGFDGGVPGGAPGSLILRMRAGA